MSDAIYSFDFSVLDGIQEYLRAAWLDTIVPYITMLGNAGIFWILLTAVFLLIPSKRRTGIVMAIALIIDVIVCNGILKPLVARIRPYDLHTGIDLLIKAPTDFSFPSGHSAASFAASSALMYRKDRLWIPAMFLAMLIALSRLYLYVHYPTDVICGILVGFLAGWLGYCISKKWIEPRLDQRIK